MEGRCDATAVEQEDGLAAFLRDPAELGQQRAKCDPPAFLDFGEMIAMDHRQRIDAAADGGIGGARFGRGRVATVDVEQGRDHLQIVLHPVMNFAHQPSLAVQRIDHLLLRRFQPVHRALEGGGGGGRAFAEGLAHTVLAVPIAQERATMHLDTICTMVDRDAVVMFPAVADTLSACTVTPADDGGLRVSEPAPFLEAAAAAMGLDRLRTIDTGLDPVTAEREQWDDGNNTLAVGPKLAVAYERNVETNERLEAAGIEVIPIAGSELGSGRGGPRCMSCPISREPV